MSLNPLWRPSSVSLFRLQLVVVVVVFVVVVVVVVVVLTQRN